MNKSATITCYDKSCNSRNENEKLSLVYIKWNDASHQEGPI
jgi:hypothetical protein